MSVVDLVAGIADFDALSPRDKICLFAWYLHSERGLEQFGNAEIRDCFRQVGSADPGISTYLPRMAEKRPPDLIARNKGYFLERRIRLELDKKYGANPITIAVSNLLKGLPAKIPNIAEKTFLEEAISCYSAKAFRSAIVMTWNLAFDHLLRWILADADRLAAFNAAFVKRYPKKAITVATFDNFEELKESEAIEVCSSASLFSSNIVKILRQKLDRRNIAAHPSGIIITQPQADDAITDLVNNVILQLT